MFDVLSEADLVAASSRLTLRRARADAAMVPAEIQHGLAHITVAWHDATCTFPVGVGLIGSSCTCPARRLCRHRLRTVLYLQRQPAEDDDWSIADIPRAAIEKAAGRTLLRQASEALHDGLDVRAESSTAVVIPSLGVRVRFLPRQPLSAALCSCGAVDLCVHRVLAALSRQPTEDRPTRPTAPEEDALRQRARATVRELLLLGLDGTPAAASEGLAALSQRLTTVLPAPADDLLRLSRLLTSYHSRSAHFSARAWTMGTGRLLARLMALEAPERTIAPDRLRGRARRTRLAATNLDLLGLGAEGFIGPGGAVVKCWFVLEQTGDVVTGTVGRGARDGEPPSTAALWWQPMWGSSTPAVLAHARLRLPAGRLSPDGSLGGAKGPVQVRPGPATPSDLPPSLLADGVGALRAMWTALPPPLLRAPRQTSLPAVIALAQPPGPPCFHEASQRLMLPVRLEDGSALTLEVRHGPATRRTIAVLERVRAWEAPPTHMLVRFWPTASGMRAAPISAWLSGQAGPVSLGLGETPLRRGVLPDPQRPLPRAPSESVPLRRLRELLVLLERIASAGLTRDRHGAPLHRAAASLADLGLLAAAQATAALADAPTAEGFVAVLAWASAAEEAWLLQEMPLLLTEHL